eukprot:scaffold16730_cov66-Phaeocystis_antarctica.AAC.4
MGAAAARTSLAGTHNHSHCPCSNRLRSSPSCRTDCPAYCSRSPSCSPSCLHSHTLSQSSRLGTTQRPEAAATAAVVAAAAAANLAAAATRAATGAATAAVVVAPLHSSPPPAPPPRLLCRNCHACTRRQTTASRRRPWLLATSCPGCHSGSTPPPPQQGHAADAHANGGARGAVVGEREEVARGPTGRLGVDVGPRSTHASRGAGARGRRSAQIHGECIRRSCRVAATRRPAKPSDAAAEVKGCCRQRRRRRGRQQRRYARQEDQD